jgi:hypothetical protein
MAAVELRTSHSDFHELHQLVASERGKYRKVERELLVRLLMDHSSMVSALGANVKEIR